MLENAYLRNTVQICKVGVGLNQPFNGFNHSICIRFTDLLGGASPQRIAVPRRQCDLERNQISHYALRLSYSRTRTITLRLGCTSQLYKRLMKKLFSSRTNNVSPQGSCKPITNKFTKFYKNLDRESISKIRSSNRVDIFLYVDFVQLINNTSTHQD